MGFELSILNGDFTHALIQRQAVDEVLHYNDLTAQYGLILTEPQAIALVKTRSISLKETGRIEFGGGVIDKIIFAFYDSPYLSLNHYEETLHELIKIFYDYKNETLDLINDKALIRYMKKSFDGICQGSMELLAGRELELLARNLRRGDPIKDLIGSPDLDEDEEDLDGEF